jgi:small subunit ribosomal protein S19
MKAKKKLIVTWSRASTIIPIMIGQIIDIHNEKEYLPIYIIDRMVSHKFNRICTYSQFSGTCKK